MSTQILSHNTSCIAAATKILGDKWTPLLVNCLAESPQRFCQIQEKIGGINPRTLTARIHSLESQGIIQKTTTQTLRQQYTLTQKGHDLLPIINSMLIWGNKYAQ